MAQSGGDGGKAAGKEPKEPHDADDMVPEWIKYPITFGPMVNPVQTADGFSNEFLAVQSPFRVETISQYQRIATQESPIGHEESDP